jgi:hypothetical protein
VRDLSNTLHEMRIQSQQMFALVQEQHQLTKNIQSHLEDQSTAPRMLKPQNTAMNISTLCLPANKINKPLKKHLC